MLGIPTPPELGAGNATSPLVVGGPLAIGPSVPRAILDMPLAGDLSLRRGTGSATFTRSTIGTFVDRIDGLVKTAAIDAARFEQNGILIEGASDNLLSRSEEFDNAAWGKTRSSISANAVTAPDGAITADKLVEDSTASSTHLITRFIGSLTASQDHTFSFFAQKAGRDKIRVQLASGGNGGQADFDLTAGTTSGLANLGTGTAVRASITVIGDFFRCQLTVNSTNTSYNNSVLLRDAAGNATYNGDGTSGIFLWGAQLEQLPFASSYIKTVASTVTRTADNLSIDAANIPAPTLDYSVSATVETFGANGSSPEGIFNVEGETFRFLRADSGAAAFSSRHGATVLSDTPNITNIEKVVMTADISDTTTGQKIYRDGILAASGAITAVTGTATSISIGKRAATDPLFGHIKDFRIFDVALTAPQVRPL